MHEATGKVQVEGAPQRPGRVWAANLGESGTCHKMEEIELVGAHKRVVGVNECVSVGGDPHVSSSFHCPPRRQGVPTLFSVVRHWGP